MAAWQGPRKLAEILEARKQEANRNNPPTAPKWIQFTRPGTKAQRCTKTERSLLSIGGEWQLAADLDRRLKFPAEITMTALCPDIVHLSAPARVVIMVELTVPWEEQMEAAYERKKDKYADLSATCSQAGWRAFTFPVEVGCIMGNVAALCHYSGLALDNAAALCYCCYVTAQQKQQFHNIFENICRYLLPFGRNQERKRLHV